MGFKKNQSAGFYPGSTTAIAVTWMSRGICNKTDISQLVGMPANLLRHYLKPHIIKQLIKENDTNWYLTELGVEKYKQLESRRKSRAIQECNPG